MTLPIINGSNDYTSVRCPKSNNRVSTNKCLKCDWLDIVEANCVKCRYTKEKDNLRKGISHIVDCSL